VVEDIVNALNNFVTQMDGSQLELEVFFEDILRVQIKIMGTRYSQDIIRQQLAWTGDLVHDPSRVIGLFRDFSEAHTAWGRDTAASTSTAAVVELTALDFMIWATTDIPTKPSDLSLNNGHSGDAPYASIEAYIQASFTKSADPGIDTDTSLGGEPMSLDIENFDLPNFDFGGVDLDAWDPNAMDFSSVDFDAFDPNTVDFSGVDLDAFDFDDPDSLPK